MAEYFLIGFLTAFGWWAAGKVTDQIDAHIQNPPAVEQFITK